MGTVLSSYTMLTWVRSLAPSMITWAEVISKHRARSTTRCCLLQNTPPQKKKLHKKLEKENLTKSLTEKSKHISTEVNKLVNRKKNSWNQFFTLKVKNLGQRKSTRVNSTGVTFYVGKIGSIHDTMQHPPSTERSELLAQIQE